MRIRRIATGVMEPITEEKSTEAEVDLLKQQVATLEQRLTELENKEAE